LANTNIFSDSIFWIFYGRAGYYGWIGDYGCGGYHGLENFRNLDIQRGIEPKKKKIPLPHLGAKIIGES